MERVEVFAQAGFDLRQHVRARAGANEAAGELVHLLGERVVGARDAHELGELLLDARLLLAQHLDLPLDERDGRAGAGVRQLQACEQRLVALEEVRVVLQVAGDGLFLGLGGGGQAPGRLVSSSLQCSRSNLDSAFEGHFGRPREPDRLTRARPVYAQLAAAHAYLDALVQSTVMSAHRDGCACARSAGECLTGAALVDAQVDVRAVEYFHEAHVHALRKTPMALDGGTEAIHGRGFDRRYREHSVRIAHGDRADVHLRAGDFERIDVSFAGCVERKRGRREIRDAHVDGDERRPEHPGIDEAGGAVHRERVGTVRRGRADGRRRRYSARRCHTARPRRRRS